MLIIILQTYKKHNQRKKIIIIFWVLNPGLQRASDALYHHAIVADKYIAHKN